MGLVGVADLRGEPRKVGRRLLRRALPHRRQEATEAQDPRERPRSVADRRVESPQQLPFADAERVGEAGDIEPPAGPRRRADRPAGLERKPIRLAPRAQARALCDDGLQDADARGLGRRGEPLGECVGGVGAPQLRERDGLVAQRVERQPERRAARTGPPADADRRRARWQRGDRGPGRRAGDEQLASGEPDQVDAAVRQDPLSQRAVDLLRPAAGEQAGETGSGRQLSVDGARRGRVEDGRSARVSTDGRCGRRGRPRRRRWRSARATRSSRPRCPTCGRSRPA